MKAKYSFEIMELDDDKVAVPVGKGAEQFHGVLKVNETAVDILKLLENETNEMQIVNALLTQYSGERNEIAGYVHDFVERLKAEGLVPMERASSASLIPL